MAQHKMIRAYLITSLFFAWQILCYCAEALNHLGRDPEALTLLNQIRTRAGTAPYQGAGSALATAILEERLRELFYEGQSYYDLVRTKQLTNYNQSFLGGSVFKMVHQRVAGYGQLTQYV